MRILITGGAGFLGSHLCDKYVKEGHTVICFDNFMSGTLTNIKPLLNYRNFKLVKGDIRDYDKLKNQIEHSDIVIHLAAQIHVDRSYVEPKLTYDINVMGTQNVLELSRIHDIQKVIHASSSEVYGSAQYSPMDEKHPLDAPHPYGASKTAADRLCHSYSTTYKLNVVAPRLFNIFGPRQRGIGYASVISIFARRVLMGYPPIIYDCGKQTRDYTYISDAVNAYDLILKYDKNITEPINIGTGKETSIYDIANLVIEFCGKKGIMTPVNMEPRIGELNRLICDNSRIKELLGWVPEVSFKVGLKKFVDYYKNYGLDDAITL